jgi:hypothetical protein
MADAPGGSGGQLDGDVGLAWSYAINADLARDLGGDADASQQHARELMDTRRRLYIKYLLYDLRCDLDRITAVARECGIRAAADGRLGGYRTAAELADSALTLIREAEAVNGPSGQRLLLEELEADLTGSAGRDDPGLKDPHRRARRILSRGCGVGTRALKCLRREYRGYTWSTSAQYSWARTFWQMTSRHAGGGYQEASPCEHLKS